jgi:hypothetical protein
MPPHVPQNAALCKQTPFPEPYLAYLTESPAKEHSLHVPLTQLPQRQMPHTWSPPFTFHRPRYAGPLSGPPAGSLWEVAGD